MRQIRLLYHTPLEIKWIFPPGRSIRIYNDDISSFFNIIAAEKKGKLYWLTFDQTALVAWGPASKAEDGYLEVSEYFQFANHHAFAGLWLGEGEKTIQIQSASNSGWYAKDIFSSIQLDKEILRNQLEEDFVGKIVSVWQYGIGDKVEVARIRKNPKSL